MTLEEGRKKGEKEAIEANLCVLKDSEHFNNSNITTRTMMLALECGVSAQIMAAKLKTHEIDI